MFSDKIAQMRTLLDSSPVGIMIFNDKARILYANPLAESLFKKKVTQSGEIKCGEFIGCKKRHGDPEGCGNTLHCPACPLYQTILSVLSDDRPSMIYSGETLLERDTEPYFIWIKYKAAGFQIDYTRNVILYVDDITDQKKIEETLRDSEERFRAAFMGSPNAIVISTQEKGVWVDVNQVALDMFGYTREEIIGKRASGTNLWVDPIDRQRFLETLKQNEEVKNQEAWLRRKDGSMMIASVSVRPLTIKGLKHLLFVAEDMTDRKLSEKKLQDMAERLNLATRAARLGIWDWDIKKNELIWNDGMQQLYGIREDEFENMYEAWLNRIHPDDRLENARLSEQARRGEGEYDTEFRIVWPDGSIRHIKTLGQVLWDSEGNSIRMTGINYDITDQKEMKTRIQQAQKMEAIGTLAGGITHDFNNILFPILGMAEMLMEDLPKGSPEHDSVREIYTAARRGGDLVKQIMAFSRQTKQQKIPLKSQLVIQEALLLSRSAISSNIEIKQNIQHNCGVVMADPTQLHQIAMNLITNAYHAVQETGGFISVSLKETILSNEDLQGLSIKPGKYAQFTCSDTGCGISPENLDRIFEPYFTTKGKDKGTGLGLAIVHGIVKEHNGDIRVFSELGKGTTFNIYLPLAEKFTEAGFAEMAEIPHQTGTERILLVDDETPVARVENQMLKSLGYRVTSCLSSIDALNTFKTNPDAFDLVVTDMNMPKMTGGQLTKEIHAINPDMPVIICTGFSEKISQETAEGMGVKGLLMKPVIKADMAKMVRKVLDESKENH